MDNPDPLTNGTTQFGPVSVEKYPGSGIVNYTAAQSLPDGSTEFKDSKGIQILTSKFPLTRPQVEFGAQVHAATKMRNLFETFQLAINIANANNSPATAAALQEQMIRIAIANRPDVA